ncbi:hypothetical protein ATG_05220 [Desulfurococcaceae archaeon AG1]|nr:MAG: hypothetical protein DJ555_01395 [Desulfurococcaceae archaeon]GAY25319.1 hypothetical protein ATG_05220 [Desulfurococcaceae archaeon AG1]
MPDDGGLRGMVKEDLISIIVDAGLLDEFIRWLSTRLGGHVDPVKLDSVDIKYMVEFLREKNLVSEDNSPLEIMGENPDLEESVRKTTKEKRTRKYKPT